MRDAGKRPWGATTPSNADGIVPPATTARTSRGGGGAGARRGDLSRVARDGSLKLGGSILSDLLGFVFVVIAARGFGKIDAARFFEAIALATICTNIAKLGADTAYVRFIPRYRVLDRVNDIRTSLAIGLVPVAILGTALGSILFFLGPQIAQLLGRNSSHELLPYIQVMAFFVPVMSVYATALAASRGFGTIRPVVLVDNVMVPVTRTAAAGAALVLGLAGISLAYASNGAILLGLIFILVWIRRLLLPLERRRRDSPTPKTHASKVFGEFWRFAGPRGVASVIVTLTGNINILLLGALSTTAGVAVFGAAYRFMKFGTLALQAVFFVISPQISGFLARDDIERAQNVYQVSTWWVMIGSWPVYIVIAVWSSFFMRHLFGASFVFGATALTIMSLGMLVSMAAGPVQVILLMGGHVVWNLANTVLTLILTAVLSLVLIPHHGIDGAALALAIATAVNNIAALIQVRVLMRLGTLGRGFWIVAAASVVCFGVVGVLMRNEIGSSIGSFGAFALLSSALYAVALYWFRDVLELGVLWDTLIGARRRGAYHGQHRRGSSNGAAARALDRRDDGPGTESDVAAAVGDDGLGTGLDRDPLDG